MKKALVFAVLFSLAVSAAQAGDAKFTGGVGLGIGAPVDGFGSAYSVGFGIDGNIGFAFEGGLAVLLAIDSFLFPTDVSDISSTEVNFIPSIRYAFGSGNTKPFLIGGAGVNTNIFTIGNVSASESNLALQFGGGALFNMSPAMDLYLQAKYTIVPVDGGSFSYIPISCGLQFN